MSVHGESIGIRQEIGPSGDGTDAISNRDIRPLSFTDARDLTYHPVDFQVTKPTTPSTKASLKRPGHAQGCQNLLPDRPDQRLVDDAEDRDDVCILRLADEFGEDSDVIDRPLGVGVSHWAIQKVERAFLSRVIESYSADAERG